MDPSGSYSMNGFAKTMDDKSWFLLRFGFASKASIRGAVTVGFFLFIHTLLVVSVVEIALLNDGLNVSWYTLFIPLLFGLALLLINAVFTLVKTAGHDAERSVFLRSVLVFFLLICLASASLAALVSKGIPVTTASSPLMRVPSFDVETGVFLKRWRGSETQSDASAFLRVISPDTVASSVANTRTTRNTPLGWMSFNISRDEMKPVFDEEIFFQQCFASVGSPRMQGVDSSGLKLEKCPARSDTNWTFPPVSDLQVRVNSFCTMQNPVQGPTSQTCDTLGEPSSCLLYVYPQSLLQNMYETKSSVELFTNVTKPGQHKGVACTNECNFAFDNVCDDGWANAHYNVCPFGSDCSDCGGRLWHSYAAETLPFFPTCGFFGETETLPQQYFAPWATAHKVSCKSKCTASTVQEACMLNPAELEKEGITKCSTLEGDALYAFWDESDKLAWCCDEVSFTKEGEKNQTATEGPESNRPVIAEAVLLPTESRFQSPEDCLRACLINNYLNQEACSLIQHNAETGTCARLEYQDRLCSLTSEGALNCSGVLRIESQTGETLSWPRFSPNGATKSSMVQSEDPWEEVYVAPEPKTWATQDKNTTIYVLLSKAFADSLPDRFRNNDDMQVILAPFICFPLLIGLLLICVCCTPLNCLPDVRLTDEDICAWDYVIFKGAAYQLPQLHNFRILVIAFSLSLSQLLLFLQKAVIYGKSSMTWSFCFIPFWITSLLILASTVNVLARVFAVMRNSAVFDASSNLSARTARYHLGSERGKLILKAALVCVTLLVPGILSLALMCARLDSPVGEEVLRAVDTLYPIYIGYSIHLLAFLFYLVAACVVRLHIWRLSKLESFDLAAQAELRKRTAAQVAELKAKFLDSSSTSEELVDTLQRLVFYGQELAISHEEVRNLGHSKLAMLRAAGNASSVWTPDVAREYGQVLRYLLNRPVHRVKTRQQCLGGTLSLQDLGYGTIHGTLVLFFFPAKIRSQVMRKVTCDAARQDSPQQTEQEFLSFLEEKAKCGADLEEIDHSTPVHRSQVEIAIV